MTEPANDWTVESNGDDDGFSFGGDSAPNRPPTCTVCSKEIDWAGRGRRPKYCDEHKPVKPASTPGRSTKASRLGQAVAQQVAGIGLLVMTVQRFDGLVIIDRAESLGQTCAKIAEQNPAFRRALERALNGSAYGELILVLAMTVAPILANHSAFPPEVNDRIIHTLVSADVLGQVVRMTPETGQSEAV